MMSLMAAAASSSILAAGVIAALLGGCRKGSEPVAAEPAPGAMAPAAPSPGAVTFFAFGDPQYGGGPADKNAFHIQALNQAADLIWPAGPGFAGAGQVVGPPRGVIIAGDLTQNGQAGRNPLQEWYTDDRYAFDLNQHYGAGLASPRVAAELGLFLRDYGLRGDDGLHPFKLRWPVFEGYGNHDFDVLERSAALYQNQAPAVDVVSIRNRIRSTWPEVRRTASGNAGHYAWDWDGLHLVHLNMVGADGPAAGGLQQARDPRGALAFLEEDLATEVGASCRPVMIVMHYGFDPFSAEPRWWDQAQRTALLAALRPYNLVAILHGHVHETRVYPVTAEDGRRYDVFSLGSPYYQGQPSNGGRGHFSVFRLEGNRLDAADVSWSPANPAPQLANNLDLWTGKRVASLDFQLTTTFADGWGGWAFSKEIPTTCPTAAPRPVRPR
jgi:cytolysin (calcineurin-like family phosphatase)